MNLANSLPSYKAQGALRYAAQTQTSWVCFFTYSRLCCCVVPGPASLPILYLYILKVSVIVTHLCSSLSLPTLSTIVKLLGCNSLSQILTSSSSSAVQMAYCTIKCWCGKHGRKWLSLSLCPNRAWGTCVSANFSTFHFANWWYDAHEQKYRAIQPLKSAVILHKLLFFLFPLCFQGGKWWTLRDATLHHKQ